MATPISSNIAFLRPKIKRLERYLDVERRPSVVMLHAAIIVALKKTTTTHVVIAIVQSARKQSNFVGWKAENQNCYLLAISMLYLRSHTN